MSLFTPLRRFDPNSPELIDRPGTDPAWVREELELLERTNARFGVHRLMIRFIDRIAGATHPTRLSILDLATGAADIPRAIAGVLRARGQAATITAVDSNPSVLHIAREACRDWPEIRLEQHDARCLPYAAESFDVVMCSLALHHFSSVDAVAILRRMQELARLGYVVNDLRRTWPAILVCDMLARVLLRSPIARHDAPQSARAAFAWDELKAMAREAGLALFCIKREHAFFRMVLEGRKRGERET